MPSIGDYGVVRTPGNVGLLIRIGQGLNDGIWADYEHAFVYVGNGEIVEAAPSGARLAALSNYDRYSVAWHSAPWQWRTDIAWQARNLIGTPYSWIDYLAIATARFAPGKASKALRRYVSDSGHMICSQLVDEAYARAGVQLFNDGRLPGEVTPADLYRLTDKGMRDAGRA